MAEDDQIRFEAELLTQMTCTECSVVLDITELEPFSSVTCPDCDADQIVPSRVGDFLVHGYCGHGGMGTVYHGWDPSLDREVAIKVLQTQPDAADAKMKGFEKEAQAAARLNHPHIAQVYTFGYHNGQPYIVMELVGGDHFDEMIRDDQPLDQALVLQICLEIAHGLQEADGAGLLHGDIKPANILLDEQRRAKLVDFGLATSVGDSGGDKIHGTPYYIPPERLQRKPLNARSDIYSLGATMYHALAGQPPFNQGTPKEVAMAHLTEDATPLCELRADIDPQVQNMVMRMMERDPARRYPTYTSLIGDMSRALDALGGDPRNRGNRRTVRMKNRGSGTANLTSKRTVATGSYTRAKNLTVTPEAKSGGKAIGITIAAVLAVLVIGGTVAGSIVAGRAKKRNQATVTANAAAALTEARGRLDARYNEDVVTRLAAMSKSMSEVHASSTYALKQVEANPHNAALRQLAPKAVMHISTHNDYMQRIAKAKSAAAKAYGSCTAEADVQQIEKGAQYLGKLNSGLTNLDGKLQQLVADSGRLTKDIDGAITRTAGEQRAAADRARKQAEQAARLVAAQPPEPAQPPRVTEADLDALLEPLRADLGAYRYAEIVANIDSVLTKANNRRLDEMLNPSREQAVLLLELKRYIQTRLAARPVPKGWTHGGGARDIQGATDEGVNVMGLIIPWADVPKEQMKLLINGLVPRAQKPAAQKARLALGSALFCDWTDDKEMGKRFRAFAIQADPAIEKLIMELVPEDVAQDSGT